MRLPGGRARATLLEDRYRSCRSRDRARSQAVTIAVNALATADSAATEITAIHISHALWPRACCARALPVCASREVCSGRAGLTFRPKTGRRCEVGMHGLARKTSSRVFAMKAPGAPGTLIASKLTMAVSRGRGKAMSCEEWVQGPFGLDAGKGQTFRYQRTVLMVVHSVTAGNRIADLAPLLESDRRIQVTWTCAPSLFSAGVRDFLGSLGGVVVPWREAIQSRFDMAVAASHGSLEQVHAPVLVVPHGVGFSKYPSVWPGPGPAVRRELREIDRDRLTYHGRVVPARIVVATGAQLERFRYECPSAAAVTVVAGDLCLDRLVASMPLRHAYREALGTGRRTLVAVSSTWGPGSLLEQCPELPMITARVTGRAGLAGSSRAASVASSWDPLMKAAGTGRSWRGPGTGSGP